MKTAHIIRRFSFEEWGGTESVVWNCAKNLNAQGDPVEILATKALSPVAEEEHEGVVIRRFPYFYPYFSVLGEKWRTLDKKGGNPYVPGLLKYLKKSDFDLFHCHAMGRIAGTVRQASLAKKVPYVLSFHGGCFDVPETELQEMLRPLRGTLRYGAVLDRLIGLRHDPLKDASGVLCVGRNELAPTRERYPGKLVEYLPNGVEVSHFRTPAAFEFRERYGIPARRKMMLSVSRIDYQKNQISLLEPLLRLTKKGEDWHLVLIGPATSKWYYEKLTRLVAQGGLMDRVTIIPGLGPDSPALPAAYQTADLFVLPSQHEPFGIVVLEAWSAGVPVLVSKVGGLRYLVEENVTGFFCDPAKGEEFAALASRICSAEARELREKVIRNAGLLVEQEYSWKTICQRLLAFYTEVKARYASEQR